MELGLQRLAGVATLVTFLFACGFAQQTQLEKHAQQIRAEQPFALISASSVCDRIRAKDSSEIHSRSVDPATFESDLSALMRKSDEVILSSTMLDNAMVLSPSKDEAITFYDVKVLRSFKGQHHVGDIVTFAIPNGAISCGSEAGNDRPSMALVTHTGGFDWKGFGPGPVVLFLRASNSTEAQLMPGLRPAAGEGLQGIFGLHSKLERFCAGLQFGPYRDDNAKCIAMLESSDETVMIPYRKDPLKARYEAMAVPAFLKEVQAVADVAAQTASRH